jgi:hypothetical protein
MSDEARDRAAEALGRVLSRAARCVVPVPEDVAALVDMLIEAARKDGIMCFDGRKPEAEALMRAIGATKADVSAAAVGPGTPADVCRANGWDVGDILEYEDHGGTSHCLCITAVGEEKVLARWLHADGTDHAGETDVWPGLLDRATRVG